MSSGKVMMIRRWDAAELVNMARIVAGIDEVIGSHHWLKPIHGLPIGLSIGTKQLAKDFRLSANSIYNINPTALIFLAVGSEWSKDRYAPLSSAATT